jgi:hypothetical protein
MKRFVLFSASYIVAATLWAAPVAAQQPGRLFGTQADPTPAPPQPPGPTALAYTAPTGCPTEAELRNGAASRIGVDPFVAPGAPAVQILSTTVSQARGGYVATVELRESGGRLLWTRPPIVDPDCRRLVSIIATITVPTLLDPPRVRSAPEPPQPPPPAPPPPAAVAPPPSPPVPDTKATSIARPAFRLGARGGVAIAAAPAVAGSLSADIGAGWEHFSINLEGRADVPVSGVVDGGVRLRTSIFAGSIVPCGHYKWFVGCGLVTVGAFRAEGVGLGASMQGADVYFAAGLRAGLEWPIVPAFALRLSGDMLVNLHPIAADVLTVMQPKNTSSTMEIWRSGPFTAIVGAGVVARFGGPS